MKPRGVTTAKAAYGPRAPARWAGWPAVVLAVVASGAGALACGGGAGEVSTAPPGADDGGPEAVASGQTGGSSGLGSRAAGGEPGSDGGSTVVDGSGGPGASGGQDEASMGADARGATTDAGAPADASGSAMGTADETGAGDGAEGAPADAKGAPADAKGAPADAGASGPVAGAFRPCRAAGGPCVIMPLGDSITFGHGSTTGAGYRVPLFSRATADKHAITFVGSQTSGPAAVGGAPFPQENEGHPGYAIDDSGSVKGIAPLVDHALATYAPNIVLLMIGTNDMHYSIDLANAPARLGRLLDQITADAPNALVFVAKIIPAKGAQDTPTRAYNAVMPGVVQPRIAQGKHLVLVDMYAALGSWSLAEYTDSEHPNDAGYALMAQTWYAAIQNVLP